MLAPDVVLIADGGGQVAAARKPITGAEKVMAFLARAARIPDVVTTTVWLNGMPSVRIDVGGEAAAVSPVVEDGRITRIYAMRNPDKLGGLEEVAELKRCPPYGSATDPTKSVELSNAFGRWWGPTEGACEYGTSSACRSTPSATFELSAPTPHVTNGWACFVLGRGECPWAREGSS